MTKRQRLPNRRQNQTFELIYENMTYAVTFGYEPTTGEVQEAFTHGAKIGSAMDSILDDCCVLLSIMLQHDIRPSSFAGSMGYHGVDKEPSSIVGRLVNLLARQEKKK